VSPLPPPAERPLQAVGARRAEPSRPSTSELVRTLRSVTAEGGGLVALLDADAVAGERHLLSAWAHLGRSRSRGAARLRDPSAEFVLYVAGDDQLPRALAKVGITDATQRFVVVAERPRTPEQLAERFGLVVDRSAYPRPVTPAILERLGISEADRGCVPESAWEGLVLERVALVDLSACTARAPSPKP
jgi:tRNA threonylcarbamoyladenosine modification (KEOPS) complex Cgi121 subunit